MAKINVLPKSVAELISAGEVVERPMSAVKELVENAIDAGATRITVEIKSGGIRYLRVSDNGCGIHHNEVRTAFINHATSKLKSAEDLFAVFTLGFRGEALPSIAAVSRFMMLTKTADEETGTQINIEGGEEISFESAGCPNGTTVTVRDLFYNTPARMKFLKKDVTEGTYVTEAVAKIAVSHPEIAFTLIKDEKRVLSTPGNTDLYTAVYAVFGKEVGEGLLKVQSEVNGIGVKGYISKPLCNRATRNMQYMFVNNRWVRIPVASAALDEAYKNSIMVGKFPMCFLFLEVPADKIDVNVHPAKSEVRFSEDAKIFEAIFYAARAALTKGDIARPSLTLTKKADITQKPLPGATQLSFVEASPPMSHDETKNMAAYGVNIPNAPEKEDKTPKADEPLSQSAVLEFRDTSGDFAAPKKPSEASDKKTTGYRMPWQNNTNINISVQETVAEDKPPQKALSENEDERKTDKPFCSQDKSFQNPPGYKPVSELTTGVEPFGGNGEVGKPPLKELTVLGEAFSTYLIAQYGDKLLFIDKHAAHERMLYEQIVQNAKLSNSQILLSPVSVTLTGAEFAAVMENLKVFEEAGYRLEEFGGTSVKVTECPMWLTGEDIAAIVTETAGKLLSGNKRAVPEKLSWLYHSTACRAAIKAGDSLSEQEMVYFVKKLLKNPDLKYCPHGRPVLYELSRHEIEKQFGRLG